MSAELPAVTAKQVARIAERIGFELRRQRGSHAIYVRTSDKARVVIPLHSGDLKRKTLRGIIADLKLSVEEFQRLL
ncbi:MAG TPA: type II toxin-antitoxin system HicA family toxin [Candidatus Acidoferrales bacterium]|nr:type II toxin-antitoxin system HicA family toxin [Candidatus Acidoferrales bacterium]